MKKIFKQLYSHWMKFAEFLGKITSPIILTGLFGIIGLYGIGWKLFSLLKNTSHKPAKSYWLDCDDLETDLDDFTHQF